MGLCYRFQENGHEKTAQSAEQPAASFNALQLTRVIGSRHSGQPVAQNGRADALPACGPGQALPDNTLIHQPQMQDAALPLYHAAAKQQLLKPQPPSHK